MICEGTRWDRFATNHEYKAKKDVFVFQTTKRFMMHRVEQVCNIQGILQSFVVDMGHRQISEKAENHATRVT